MSEPTPQPVQPVPPAPESAAAPGSDSGAAPAPESVAAPAAVAAPPPPAIAAPAPAAAPPRPSFFEASSIRPTVIIAIIIAALFYGTQILNEALPAVASEVPVSASGAVDIGQGARITPVAGWSASPHESGNGIRLGKGIVALDLFVEAFGASAQELAEGYRDQVLAGDTTQFTSTDIEVVSAGNGTSAARFRYQGVFTGVDVAVEGEVTVLFANGVGVVADAWTRQGDLDKALGEVHDMVATIELAQ